ncbi:MAG: PaaI family thioesterase [Deltaproteobacteria bacterium]|nr:PaaI family thioesterase [Deltaproteobacteria bacterium]
MPRNRRRAELLHAFNEVAPIARTFGMTLAFTDDDRAVCALPYNPNLDHAQGGVHGGIYATLLDSAGWFASAVTHPEGVWVTTAEMSIHFLRASRTMGLRAEGRILKRGRRQDVGEMFLYDDADELVGHATGTFLVLPHVPMAQAGPEGGGR